jgi:peptidoglycan hydrolase CwlO-like protein
VGVKELLAQIVELAQKGLEQHGEAERMERFLAETSRKINTLNERISACEWRVDAFIKRAQQAVTDTAASKPKPKRKVARSKRL